jgi:glucose-1-phosphate thymidylyltransferase
MVRSAGSDAELVGLLPAAGLARRIEPLPCSKELFPVGFWSSDADKQLRPKAAAHHLLEKMAAAGATRAFIVLRRGKWDVPAYFADGRIVGMDLGYVIMRRPYGVPFTIDDAYPFVRDAVVLFGFPDILFQPQDVFARLLAKRQATGAEVVLAVFPARQPEKMDMVELDERGRISRIVIKPGTTTLTHTWLVAVWGAEFTSFMHQFVAEAEPAVAAADGQWVTGSEMYVGDVIRAAIEAGTHVETVSFDAGTYVDIGTPEDLAAAVAEHASAASPGVRSTGGGDGEAPPER